MHQKRRTGRECDRQLLQRLKNNLIDEDLVVDDCRVDVDQSVERLRSAVARRDTTARQMLALVEKVGG